MHRFCQKSTAGVLACVLLAVILLTFPIDRVQSAPRIPTDTLVVAQGLDPRCLSPLSSTAQQEKNVSGQVVERLVRFAPDYTGFVPELAMGWKKQSADTLRLTLRQGVRFTNGEPFNAESVKYSIEQMTRARAYGIFVSEIKGAEIVDASTVDVKAIGPTSEQLMLAALALGGFQYPPIYTERVGLLRGFCQQPIGTGPFKFVEWVKDSQITLEANPDYWGGLGRIRRLVFRPIPEGAARVAALQAGDIDISIDITSDAWDRLGNDRSVARHWIRGMRIFNLTMGAKFEGPLQNRKVRQAMQHAIDVDTIIRAVLKGRARRLQGQMLTQEFIGYQADFKATLYDPEKTRKMLAEAGFPSGFEVTFKYPSGRYAQDKEVSEVIASQLLKVGVRTKQEVLEPGEFLRQLNEVRLRDMYFGGSLLPPDAHYWYIQYVCDYRYPYWCRPDFDALKAKAAATASDRERVKIYREMALLMQEDPPTVPLYAPHDLYATRSAVAGWRPSKDQFLYLAKAYKRD